MQALIWLFVAGPVVLFATALLPRLSAGFAAHLPRLAPYAALFALACAIGAAVTVGLAGPQSAPLIGAHGIGLSLYIDALTVTLYLLVAFIGVIVLRYSRNYLDGDPGHARFTTGLCLTLSAILLVILSGNLLLFWLAWIATSLTLNQLLLFYPERQAALLAARKKFVISRIGDLCLLGAMLLLYHQFATLDIPTLLADAKGLALSGGALGWVPLAALLLVITALLKSAQFPLHGWLLEVMETPTPVSALLHAGIVNAGGYLVLRMGGLISLSPGTLEVLVVVGGLTALFGSLVMLTQTSIKVSLAYSTIGQMGFMMLECGLGAFPAALLHIVGHSLYKAHAFLSSGSVIDLSRAAWTPPSAGRAHPARLVFAAALMIVLAVGIGALLGLSLKSQPGVVALGIIVLLGLAHLVANAIDDKPNLIVIARTLGIAVLVAIAYFLLQLGVEHLYAHALPAIQKLRGPADLLIVVLVILGFAAVIVLQSLVGYVAARPRWQAVYVHLANGLYVNTWANRAALAFWPTRSR